MPIATARPWRILLACAGVAVTAACSTLPPPADDAGAGPAATQASAAKAAAAVTPTLTSPAPTPSGPVAPRLVAPPAGLDPLATTGPLPPFIPEQVAETEAITDLWERMRVGFRLKDLDNRLVNQHVQWYASRPDYVQRMNERAGRYLYFILEEVERRNLPTEVALLPFIESAFNPQAMSHAAASGMWQFIPGTGRVFGLEQSMFRDERRDVVESTRAALDYLEKLYGMFGDWHLAFAAYNCGEGNVQRAIERNRRRGKPVDYSNLPLPNETRHYVPKLQAVKNIVMAPAQYGLSLPELENEQYFVTVTKTRDIDVERAAAFAGMPVDEFLALNPSFNKPVILGAMQPQILLPREKADQFLANLAFSDGPLSSYTVYRVTGREKIDAIATRFGTTAEELRTVNQLPRGVILRPGATLLVPRGEHVAHDVSETMLTSAALLYDTERPTRKLTVKARRGDTVDKVARRFGVTGDQVRDWNRLAGNTLTVGQALTVYQPITPKATKKPVRRTSGTAQRAPASKSAKTTAGRPARAASPQR